MSRRVYLLGVGLALVALALAFTDWALTPPPGVTEANARRIRPGMTLDQVGDLLGGPGIDLGDYFGRLMVWGEQGATVQVRYDDQRLVVWAEFKGATAPGLLSRLRSWLGW
jgi:hypothetical protein